MVSIANASGQWLAQTAVPVLTEISLSYFTTDSQNQKRNKENFFTLQNLPTSEDPTLMETGAVWPMLSQPSHIVLLRSDKVFRVIV